MKKGGDVAKKKQQKKPRLYLDAFIKKLLYDNNLDNQWLDENEKDIKTIINYVWNIFQMRPDIMANVYPIVSSYEYNSFKLIDKIKYLQKILKDSNISFNDLYFFRKDYTKKERKDYAQYLEESDFGDLSALYGLHKKGYLNLDRMIESMSIKHEKRISNQDKEKIEELVKEHEEKELQKSEPVIHHLTQEIIDELELSLFDVAILQKYNQIIYTFINKYNQKVVYKEPFAMQFYWHAESDLLKKDYFEDNHKLYPYVMNDSSYLYKFNQAIRDNFKRSCRQVSKSKLEEASWF